jgi:hypothetical protein
MSIEGQSGKSKAHHAVAYQGSAVWGHKHRLFVIFNPSHSHDPSAYSTIWSVGRTTYIGQPIRTDRWEKEAKHHLARDSALAPLMGRTSTPGMCEIMMISSMPSGYSSEYRATFDTGSDAR